MSEIKRHAPYAGLMHEVVEHNGILYFGGIVSDDLKLDMTGQAEDVMRQLKTLLAANGSDLTRLLQVTLYFPDLSKKPEFDAVWKKQLGDVHMPGRAGIGVNDLGPGALVEIVVIAAKA